MTGCIRGELLAAHERLVNNGDSLIADGSIGIGDPGISSALRADGGREPPVVMKIGGAKTVNPGGAVPDVVHLVAGGINAITVHGGSTAVDETLEEPDEELMYVESPSDVSGCFIDEHAMKVFSMVVPGKLNTDLTVLLHEAGVSVLGPSDIGGGLLTGPHRSAVRVVENGKKKVKCGDHFGKITSVDATLLETLLDDGYMPIVTTLMLADDGMPVNVGADRVAAVVAGTFGAKLAVLTDVKDICADPDDESTFIETADMPEELLALESVAEGFMTKKVMTAKETFDGRAAEVVVADADLNDPIVTAFDGGGTHVTSDALVEAEGVEQ